MSNFLEFLKALLPSLQSQRERDESYLAEAQNIADLEQRIRELETRGRNVISDLPRGLGLW
jgi:hypothetical protein